jgi:DNA helicase II / ATP-dependent DNA helicase PcrA
MNEALRLRPAQEEILSYSGGRMAVSAVPGSGKTFTLSLLAAQLIAENRIDPNAGQQILIVTFLNSSVETFRARIRRRLLDMGLPDAGFDVRTLHSLALEIVRWSGESMSEDIAVLDETQSRQYLEAAVDGWINDHNQLWEAFLPDDGREFSPLLIARWRDITATTAASFIRTAKNERYKPEDIIDRIRSMGQSGGSDRDNLDIARSPLMHMLAGIYSRYQITLERQGSLDYDDLIWQATDRLEHRPDLVTTLRNRWPFVLEDEAQDSVPLQELLLEQLTGPDGNWVRVGDPNQAITSTFTAAHPRYFSQFIDRPDVVARTLPNSGRSARLILGAANAMLNWTIDHHPVEEVRTNTFRQQEILPTPPGDSQPNPPDEEARFRIRVYRHREEEELPSVARQAWDHTQQQPEHTLAILVPTHHIGYQIAEHLDALDADYDNMLRGSGREREIAAALHAVLGVLANPLDNKSLQAAHSALDELHEEGLAGASVPVSAVDSEDSGRFQALLRSIRLPEALLFPTDAEMMPASLPSGITTEEDIERLERLASFFRQSFRLRDLPIDDLVLTLADLLFAPAPNAPNGDPSHELDLAIAYQIAGLLRQWREAQPDWRLPELVAQLRSVATGRRTINVVRANDAGYEPVAGRISLATQHSAKGLEWDTVFLVGIDGMWIPGSLEAPFLGVHEFLGGDPTAEANAQLRYLMKGESGLYPDRTATESAHIESISERLRLLYVGITRARRHLNISRSRATRQHNREREAEPATVLGVLYQYLQSSENGKSAED